ncbi:MAG: hypothetical protein AAF432_09810 [Planctomycetota bacterium]
MKTTLFGFLIACAVACVPMSGLSPARDHHGAKIATLAPGQLAEIIWDLSGTREIDALIAFMESDRKLRRGLTSQFSIESGGIVPRAPATPDDHTRRVFVNPPRPDIPRLSIDVYTGSGLSRAEGPDGEDVQDIFAHSFRFDDEPGYVTIEDIRSTGTSDLFDVWFQNARMMANAWSILTRAHLAGVDAISYRPNLHAAIYNDTSQLLRLMEDKYAPSPEFFRHYVGFDASELRAAETSQEFNRAGLIAISRADMLRGMRPENPIIEMNSDDLTVFVIDWTNRQGAFDGDDRIRVSLEIYGPDSMWMSRIECSIPVDVLRKDGIDLDPVSIVQRYITFGPLQ